jgi:hypothetical protein
MQNVKTRERALSTHGYGGQLRPTVVLFYNSTTIFSPDDAGTFDPRPAVGGTGHIPSCEAAYA